MSIVRYRGTRRDCRHVMHCIVIVILLVNNIQSESRSRTRDPSSWDYPHSTESSHLLWTSGGGDVTSGTSNVARNDSRVTEPETADNVTPVNAVTSHDSSDAQEDAHEDEDEVSSDSTAQILLQCSRGLYKYGMTVVFILGLFGNTLALVVFIKGSMRATSSVLYLIALAVIDQIVIFSAVLGSHVIRSFWDFDYIRYNRWFCKTAYFIIVTAAQSSFYLVACMSVERALITWKPFRFMVVFTRNRTKWIVVTIVSVWALKNSLKFWTQGETYETIGNVTRVKSECGILDGDLKYYAIEIRPWFDYAITFTAVLIIVVANIIIILQVHQSSKMQQDSAAYRKDKASSTSKQMITMLVTTSVVFLILALPLQIVTIIIPRNPNDAKTDAEALANLLWSIGLVTSYGNNAMNFYVYCLSGSLFRDELLVIFGCKKTPQPKSFTTSASIKQAAEKTAEKTVEKVPNNNDSGKF